MPDDAATNNNATADANAATNDGDNKGDVNNDDTPKDSDGGFADFLDNVLGDDLDSDGDDSNNNDANDSKPDPDDKDVKVDPKKADPDDDQMINLDDVLADDQLKDGGDDANDDDANPPVNPLEATVTAQAEQINQLITMVKDANKPPEPEPEPEIDIFEDETFNQLADILDVDDDGKKALQTFLTKLVDHTQKKSLNQMMDATPNLIGKVMESKNQIENITTKFYTENAELAAVKPFVKEIAVTISKENPGYDMAKVLDEAATKAYKVLGITKKKPVDNKGKGDDDANPNAGGDKDKKKKPAFPNTQNARKAPAKKSKMASEIDAMLETLD